MNILCKLGIHKPLKHYKFLFIDKVSDKVVYLATCSCGKEWMTDSFNAWFGYKTRRE